MIAFRTCLHGHRLIDNKQTYNNHGWLNERCRACNNESVYRVRARRAQPAQRFAFRVDPTDPMVQLARAERAKRGLVNHGR